MNELIELVKQWGVDKGITGPNGKGTIGKQFRKFVEEFAELFEALKKDDVKEVRDALGDLQVVIVQANSLIHGIDTIPEEECATWFEESPIEEIASDSIAMLMQMSDISFTGVRDIARRLGHDPDACLQAAYDEIKGRTGQMVNGTFIKDV